MKNGVLNRLSSLGSIFAYVRTASGKKVLERQEHLDESSKLLISSATLAELRRVLPGVWEGKKSVFSDQVKLLNDDYMAPVFCLKNAPDVVFKLSTGEHGNVATGQRFSNMKKAQKAIAENDLDRLVVPKAALVHETINSEHVSIIAEEKLNIAESMEAQEEIYRNNDNHLSEVFKQLTIFIVKTGFDEVEFRNIPLVPSDSESSHWRVALVDLEHLGFARSGLVGGMYRGLVACSSPRHFATIRIENTTPVIG